MGNRKGLTIFALLMSLIAVGLGGYIVIKDVIAPTSLSSKIENIYYTERSVPWYPTGTYTEVTSIDVVVREGQNLHIFFESEVILSNSATPEQITVSFYSNGAQITSSIRTVADVAPLTTSRLSLTIQEHLLNLAANTYTISLRSYSSGTLGSPGGNRIELYSLFIMVYN
ncbi:MAG: hypothetical protein ACFFCI_05030 [Promethearchaeota archaeon]